MLTELRILLLALATALPAGLLAWLCAGEVAFLISQHTGDPIVGPFTWVRVLFGLPL